MALSQELQAAHARNAELEVTVAQSKVSQNEADHYAKVLQEKAQEAEKQIGSLTAELLQHEMITQVRTSLLHVSLPCFNQACLPVGMLCSIYL